MTTLTLGKRSARKHASFRAPLVVISKTQGQLMRQRESQSGREKNWQRKLEGKRGAPGQRVLQRQFRTTLGMLASDWA